MRKVFAVSLVFPALVFGCQAAFAAKPIDLSKQPLSLLRSYVPMPRVSGAVASAADEFKETRRSVDLNQTTHIRIQQLHAGYPVWGGDAVVHVTNAGKSHTNLMSLAANPVAATSDTTMNGIVYEGLSADLDGVSPAQLESQKNKAIETAIALAGKSYKNVMAPKNQKAQLIVFVDDNQKAHWAYLVSFRLEATERAMPALPTYILDAQSFEVYQEWNDVKSLDVVNGGGFGGNEKLGTGKLSYDGLPGDLSSLEMMRDAATKTCYLQNSEVVVRNGLKKKAIESFACDAPDKDHNNLYWDASFDAVNGGYSPSNDALYAGSIIKAMYQNDYGVPMLVDSHNKPMQLEIVSHAPDINNPSNKGWENAVWVGDESVIYLGDGADTFYPLTSLGVIAHEVSHGFTQQHSNLQYLDQSGGINEAFSDMAAQAAEYHAVGRSSWQIASELMKQPATALRYMDQPSKDCSEGGKPGEDCSIDTADQYKVLVKSAKHVPSYVQQSYIVHYASGVYNRVFYLIANAPGWNVKKAFAMMAKANSDYWTASADYKHAACGVLKAAKDLRYDTASVAAQFKVVGINTADC